MKILIVDDDPTNLKLLHVLLETEGITVLDAQDGLEALQILERENVDAVISDILMPRMDGYQLCLTVRQHARLERLPVVFYSAIFTSSYDEKLALDCGADKLIRKPASVGRLMQVLHEVTTQAQYQQPRTITAQQGAEVLETYSDRLVNKLKENDLELAAKARSLADSRKQLEAIIQSVDGIVWECNALTFQFTYRSKRAERMLGYPYESSTSEDGFWIDHIHPEDQEWVLDFYVQSIAKMKNYELEYRMLAGDGSVLWVHDSVSVVSENEVPVKLRGLILNVTARKQAQEEIQRLNSSLEARVRQRTLQLQEANQELAAFSYSVSHDLRSPLNTINGFSNLLSQEIALVGASERSKHYLERIHSGTVKMGLLIDAMLSLAQTTQTPMNWSRVDLSAMAQTLLGGYQAQQPNRLARWTIEPNLAVQGDPILLLQVLDNLLSNAWRFSAKQACSEITFGCKKTSANEVTYFVQDNGAGFDMANAAELFGAFQRLHSASEFAGTGIGLATVKRIVTRHGGKVWAESTLGQGATFYFTLPGDGQHL